MLNRNPNGPRKTRERVRTALSAVLTLVVFVVAPMIAMRVLAIGAEVVSAEDALPLDGEPVDAVIVPGARVFNSGRPSGALLSRIELAEQIAATMGTAVFASGGPGEPEVIAEYLPDLEVSLDSEGFSTIDTCRNAADAGLERVAVVTQPRHRYRTAALCEAAGLDTIVVTTPTPRELLDRLPARFARERAAEYLAVFTIAVERIGG